MGVKRKKMFINDLVVVVLFELFDTFVILILILLLFMLCVKKKKRKKMFIKGILKRPTLSNAALDLVVVVLFELFDIFVIKTFTYSCYYCRVGSHTDAGSSRSASRALL